MATTEYLNLSIVDKFSGAPASKLRPGPQAIRTSVVKIPVFGTNEILEVTVVRPQGTPSLSAVVITHGL